MVERTEVEKLAEAVHRLEAQRATLNQHIAELSDLIEEVRRERDSALELLAAVPDIQKIRRDA